MSKQCEKSLRYLCMASCAAATYDLSSKKERQKKNLLPEYSGETNIHRQKKKSKEF